jgi:type I restriction enzyme S subunit
MTTQTIKLGDVCESVQYGYTASACDQQVGPKFLRITDIVPYFVDWETVPYCNISNEEKNRYKLEIGDIVIARTGATTGYNSLISENIDAVFASYLIRFKLKPDIADNKYVAYVLKSNKYFDFVGNVIGGSAQPGINAKVLSSFEFDLPPLVEQRRVAGILGSLDEKIENNRRLIRTAEALARTLFKKHIVSNEESEGWENGKISDITAITTGKGGAKSQLKKDGTIPIYGANGIMGFTDKPLLNEQVIISGRVGTIGQVRIVNGEAWFSDNVLIFTPNENCFYFTYFVLQNLNWGALNRGSSQPLITQGGVNEQEINIPPAAVLQTFNAAVEPLFAEIGFLTRENQTLAATRDKLLRKLIK